MVCFCSIFNVVVEHHLHSFAQAHTLPHATHEHDTLLNSKENSFSSFFGTKCAHVCPPLAVHPFIRKLKIFFPWNLADGWLASVFSRSSHTIFLIFHSLRSDVWEQRVDGCESRSREAFLFIGFRLFLLALPAGRDLHLIQIFFFPSQINIKVTTTACDNRVVCERRIRC